MRPPIPPVMESASSESLVPAADGRGSLLQRDYWARVGGARMDARAVGELLAVRFCDFPPPSLVRFRRRDAGDAPLRPGDELDVDIKVAGRFGVRVLHRDAQSLTIGTLAGHPEAGRITFGAYPNTSGELILHIRSRARASTRTRLLGFLFAGEPMQTATWGDFIDRLAASIGDGVAGAIHAETREVEEIPDDAAGAAPAPTFCARGA